MMKSWRLGTGLIFIGIYFLFAVNLAGAENKIKSPTYESKPKELVIYEGNLAYAKDRVQIYPADWIQISLPHTVINRTLDIIDGENRIGKFCFPTPDNPQISDPPSNLQTVKWESKLNKPRQAVLSYLLSGINWAPSYSMNILTDTKVKLLYHVAISNQVFSFPKVKVKLVSGMVGKIPQVSVPYKGSMARPTIGFEELRRAGTYSLSTVGATRVNTYYTYKLGQVETLDKGMNYITLLDKELEAEKEFVWLTSAGEKVDVIYTIKNSSEQPFAPGILDTYQDGIYMGSDMIEWTPSGSKGHVTIGGAVDIKVEKTVNITKIPEKKHTDEYHHEVMLKAENFGKKDVKLKIIDNKYPDCVDIAFSLKPKEEKNQTHMWQVELKPGKSRTIKYDFYSDSTYNKPYQAY